MNPLRLYQYVGPASIVASVSFDSPRHEVTAASGLLAWAAGELGWTARQPDMTFTYVVLPPGRLMIADRHSEHVACARGGSVLTAGEITFERHRGGLRVQGASNLSTGFCPEPDSWPALDRALRAAGFEKFEEFSPCFEFRYCLQCQQTSVIKEGIYECAVCSGPLPLEWNYGDVD